MKKRIAFSIALLMILCLALAGCGQKTSASETNESSDDLNRTNVIAEAPSEQGDESHSDDNEIPDIYKKSAWTATQYSETSDGQYEDVMSIYYGVALFIDGSTATMIYYDNPASFQYVRTADGLTSEGTDLGLEATIDGDSMLLTMLGHTWIMEKTEISDAIAYAHSIMGPDYDKIPFENDSDGTDLPDTPDNSNPDVNYVTLYDDEICTIRSAGAFMVKCKIVPESEDAAAYLLSITNNSNQTIEISGGYLNNNPGDFSYGTINGQKILSMVYADAHSEPPYFFDTAIPSIAPGETIEIYLCAFSDVTKYPTLEDLVNVSVNLYAAIQIDSNGYEHEFYNYTLPLD